MIFSNGTILSVSDKAERVNESTMMAHTGQQKNKIPCSRGSPEVPMN